MGEAKRRKAQDPNYGKRPPLLDVEPLQPSQRGLIISPPMEISRSKISLTNAIDPQELRSWVLLWDRLVWPKSNLFGLHGNDDIGYLEQVGMVHRPAFRSLYANDIPGDMKRMYLQTFDRLEEESPEAWALSQGEKSLQILEESHAALDRGVLLKLHRAVPVPDVVVPLNEILEFKQRRHDELTELHSELDRMYLSIVNSGDLSLGLRTSIETIDRACTQLLRVSKENKNPFRLMTLGAAYKAGTGAVKGASLGMTVGMPLAGGLIGGAVGLAISFGKELKRKDAPVSPYRYVQHYHEELR